MKVNNKKQLIPLILFFSMLIIMVLYPNKYTILTFPLVNFIIICFVYSEEIMNFNYNYLLKNNWFQRHTYYTLMFVAVSQAIGNIIIMNLFKIQSPDITFALQIIAAPMVSVIFSSINEEIIYRKIIFRYLDKKYGFWIGATVSSLTFSFSHYNYAGWLGYFLVGLAWCFSYKRTGNIAINIITHVIVNMIFFLKISYIGAN